MAAIAALIGAAISAKQQKDSADYQAEVDKNNAILAGYQAGDAIQRGAFDARAAEIAGDTAAGTALTEISKGGIDTTSGSAAGAIATSAINAGRDAARLRANAAREAWGFRNEVEDTLASAKFRRQAGYMGALGTGVGGIGTAASAYAQSRKQQEG